MANAYVVLGDDGSEVIVDEKDLVGALMRTSAPIRRPTPPSHPSNNFQRAPAYSAAPPVQSGGFQRAPVTGQRAPVAPGQVHTDAPPWIESVIAALGSAHQMADQIVQRVQPGSPLMTMVHYRELVQEVSDQITQAKNTVPASNPITGFDTVMYSIAMAQQGGSNVLNAMMSVSQQILALLQNVDNIKIQLTKQTIIQKAPVKQGILSRLFNFQKTHSPM